MKWLIFTPLLFILLLIPCLAQDNDFDESVLSVNGKQAYQKLLKIELFAPDPIGPGAQTSEGEKAFDILLEEKEANSAFKSLVKSATIEGGLYGLFGLKMIDCDCFQAEYIKFLESRTAESNSKGLKAQSGCNLLGADTNADKKFMIDYMVSKGFPIWIRRKKTVKENRKKLMDLKSNTQ